MFLNDLDNQLEIINGLNWVIYVFEIKISYVLVCEIE